MSNKLEDAYLAGQPINEIKRAAAEIVKGAAAAGIAALGAAAATKTAEIVQKKAAKKDFRQTVTGQELLDRLKKAIQKLKELQTQKRELTDKEFKDRAKKLEKRIVKLKRQITQKEREFRL